MCKTPYTEGLKFIYKIQRWAEWLASWFGYNGGPHNVVLLCDLPPTWTDKDEVIRVAVFTLFCEFMEREYDADIVSWKKSSQKTLLACRQWIEQERPELVKKLDDLQEKFYGSKNWQTQSTREERQVVDELQMHIDDRDKEVLHMIVDVRQELWT